MTARPRPLTRITLVAAAMLVFLACSPAGSITVLYGSDCRL
jgi:hypothetical protein